MHKKIRIGITQGEINSVSYEIIIKTFSDNRLLELFTPVVYGSPKIASYYKKTLGVTNLTFNTINSIDEVSDNKTNLVNCVDDNIRVELGKPTDESTQSALEALAVATEDLQNKKIDALITCPINNEIANRLKPNFKNNKHFVSNAMGVNEAMLMFIHQQIRVGLVSEYVPFTDILSHVNEQNILNKLQILYKSLQADFNIHKPKIGVQSLNPDFNTGELGDVEKNIIIPAIAKANKDKGILAIGPFSTDKFYTCHSENKFDAVLSMYYDQGISPMKVNNMYGANYFAGLPEVVIEPDCCLSYDMAGLNKSDEMPLREALYIAKEIVQSKRLNAKITKNPLRY